MRTICLNWRKGNFYECTNGREEGSADVGGADEMICLEYIEAWGLLCYKKVNHMFVHVRMEELFTQRIC